VKTETNIIDRMKGKPKLQPLLGYRETSLQEKANSLARIK
jgi:hypothetical protein